MALSLTDKTPFASFTFGKLDTNRPGFTFDPNWESNFSIEPAVSALSLSDAVFEKTGLPAGNTDWVNNIKIPQYVPSSAVNVNTMPDALASLKSDASKQMLTGAELKTVSDAGNFFTALINFGMGRKTNAMEAQNTKLQAEVQMKALDNEVLYYKNQIMDKFNTLIARNTVTMATKGLRVSAANLLEQTKDTAYDATKDIETLESNAELKKIALRSQQKQADITKRLKNSELAANLMKATVDLGIMAMTGGTTGQSWGNLYGNAYGSLNNTVYGGK